MVEITTIITMKTMFSLQGKYAVVTGGGSGIGAAIVRTLATAGAVVAVVDRDLAAAQQVASEITGLPGSATAHACDVADGVACRQLGDALIAQHGRCDVLVANAGIGHVGTILTTTESDLDRLWAVNVKGVFHLTQALLPSMLAQQSGSVIVTASIGGVVGIRERFAYCTTKSAVVGMVKCLALDHASSGVRFNAICPGRVETPFVAQRLAESTDPKATRAEMTATQALGRMGTPHEIAAAALYLASDESAFVTGTAFAIDGGWTAGK